MLAVKSTDMGLDFQNLCSRVMGGETVIVSSQADGNIVMLTEREYNEMAKARRNAEYLNKLDERSRRLANGEGIHKTLEELEAMEDE